MLKFAWPYVFLLLPLFWLAQKYLPILQKHNDAMLRVPFLFRIQALPQTSSTTYVVPRGIKQWLSTSIWLLLLFAAANPQWLGNAISIPQTRHNIMFAIDVSPSMEIPDLKRKNHTVNRLQTVKEVTAPFIEKRQGDKLGLILFGSKAYLQTPLTLDHKTLRYMLNDATIGLAGESTAIGDAIGLAIKKLSTENIKSRILILLTDGGNNSGEIDPLKAAELAQDNHIKIYTVGIGASRLLVSSLFGTRVVNPSADLDENLLKKISSITQGQYFRAQDDKMLADILEAINQLEPIDNNIDSIRPISALFYWPLSLALLLMLILIFPNLKVKLNA